MSKFRCVFFIFLLTILSFSVIATESPTEEPIFQPTEMPTFDTTENPTLDPSRIPTNEPTQNPSVIPTSHSSSPTFTPTMIPSTMPILEPTFSPTQTPTQTPTSNHPTKEPSVVPSEIPTITPSVVPSEIPTTTPSVIPSEIPTITPSVVPSEIPTITPSVVPSEVPSMIPSVAPSEIPTVTPSRFPSIVPTIFPSSQPSTRPSTNPSTKPSYRPSSQPSGQPSQQPHSGPTSQPSRQPSKQPQSIPSSKPSVQPTSRPSKMPSCQPTGQPTNQPKNKPSSQPSKQPISRPTQNPSRQPTSQPSQQPTSKPSSQPSRQPSRQPTGQPVSRPSSQPSAEPSGQPSTQPSSQPTSGPRSFPSAQPTNQPSRQPSRQPTGQPSRQPSRQPTNRPTVQPSSLPSIQPSDQPTFQPSGQPSRSPTTQPSSQPSLQPSGQPVAHPSAQPSAQPASHPTARPTHQPSSQPSSQPVGYPSARPSNQPSRQPSRQPTGQPSNRPSTQPMSKPSSGPVSRPTCQPSSQPTDQPSRQPSSQPTRRPSVQPSGQPTEQPSTQPSEQPFCHPTSQPSDQPSAQPSLQPSKQPSDQPTSQPSGQPTAQPSRQPTSQPTHRPSRQPSSHPSNQPSAHPTTQPSSIPSKQPSGQPSSLPSRQPLSTPTRQPSGQPSVVPTSQPVCAPSGKPTSRPINRPSAQPSSQPSVCPSKQPSARPSNQPSRQPNSFPTSVPSMQPTMQPSSHPTSRPSRQPSTQPSGQPSNQPSARPSRQPTIQPTTQPSSQPSSQPSKQPTVQPSRRPSTQPSVQPSSLPSSQPSDSPSCQPSVEPSSQPSSTPTTEDSARLFSCDGSLTCETDDFGDCAFFTGNIVFMCVNETTPCLISAGNFTVGPNTNMTVNGTCELIVSAQHYITIHPNTTIKAPAISFTAQSAVRISGIVDSSGLGPLYGASAPVMDGLDMSTSAAVTGQGGSYGGSGGRNVCNDTYFTAIPFQLGSIDILPDLQEPYSYTSPTLGSGGAAPGGGRGGGRIFLSSPNEVFVGASSLLSAEGSVASNEMMGAGSGGSITVVTGSYNVLGTLSVRGGISRNQFGGSGGGGRISITVSKSVISSAAWNVSSLKIYGGSAEQSVGNFIDNPCLSGGAGTLYLRNGLETKDVTSLSIYNANITTFASTLVAKLPSTLTLINAFDHAVVASLTNISMPLLSTCTPKDSKSNAGMTGLCSYINLNNATLVSISNMTTAVPQVDGLPHVEMNGTSYDGPFNTTVFMLSANIVNFQRSSLQSLSYLSSFGVQSQVLMLSEDSSILFSDQLVLSVSDGAELVGRIQQVPLVASVGSSVVSYYFYSTMLVEVAGNLTLNNVLVSNLAVKANKLVLMTGGSITPPSSLISSCLTNVGSSMLSCTNSHYSGSMLYNNTYALSANVSIMLKENSLVQASALLLCAPLITIDSGSSANADSRGCDSGEGKGAGGFNSKSSNNGGGGGGFGGEGGTGMGTNPNGGAVYSVNMIMFSGSGGSCFNGTCPSNIVTSRGGGIVTVVATKKLYLYGNITSNGMYGDSDDGGGSGGTVSVNARNLYGDGVMLASGGAGGNGLSPGGGGGGGYVQIYNAADDYTGYSSFKGEIAAPGGAAGSLSTTGAVELSLASTSVMNRVMRLIGGSNVISQKTGLRSLSVSVAAAGLPGAFALPDCTPGHGNSQSTGQLCQECAVGFYGLGNNSDPCFKCTNAPTHSTYTTSGCSTANCPFVCDAGRTTLNCYTPVQNFIYNVLTLAGLGACIAGFFVLVIAPLLFYRLRDKYGWFENKQMDMLGDVFKKANILDLGFGDDSLINSKRTVSVGQDSDGRLMMRNNPVYSGGKSHKNGIQDIQIKVMHARTLKDLRRVLRLADQDLPFHACRVNLLGSNHPWSSQGGAWKLPTSRPVCLRPMLLRDEYKAFAEDINRSLSWNLIAIDMCFFFLVTCIAPPLSASVMNFIRKRRTAILLDKIANYDYSCFRCLKQRLARNSLRVGISPDSTIAFIDFLFDEENFKPTMRPLCPIGQTRLPATFKLAGLGTYFSPYFVDTNDMILQAVPQTDVASSFIDEAWISFICELNTKLRTVQADALHLGILNLIQFLGDEKTSAKLGGLVVEFCTFSNETQTFPSDLEAEEEALAASQQTEIDAEEPIESPSTGSPKMAGSARKTKVKVSTDSLYDRDSFVAATRARRNSFERHSESGNWFTQLGDALNIIGHGGTPSSRNHPTSNRHQSTDAIEMKETSAIRMSDLPTIDTRPTADSISRPSNTKSRATKTTPQLPPPRIGHGRFLKCGFDALKSFISLVTRCFQFCGQFFFKESFRPEDPHGYELSFSEMCSAVQEGHLKLGILVTHPKVQSNTYIVRDDDYQSEDDDEANYSFDERPSNMSNNGERQSDAHHSDEEDDDVSTVRGSNVQDFLRSPLASRESSHSIEKAYGHKADEMAKFYKIMLAAEVTMTATSPSVTVNRPLFSPAESRSRSVSRGSLGGARMSFSERPLPLRPQEKEELRVPPPTLSISSKDKHRAKSIERNSSRNLLTVDISSNSARQQATSQYVDFRSVASARKQSEAPQYVEFGRDRGSGRGFGLNDTSLRDSGDRNSSNSLDDEDDGDDMDGLEEEDDEEEEKEEENVPSEGPPSPINRPIAERRSTARTVQSVRGSSSSPSRMRSPTMISRAESVRPVQSDRSEPKFPMRTKPDTSTSGIKLGGGRSTSVTKSRTASTSSEMGLAMKPLRAKKLKRVGGRRNLAKLHNLAPSAFQHFVNGWRWRPEDPEPVSAHGGDGPILNAIVVSPQSLPVAKSALKKSTSLLDLSKRSGGKLDDIKNSNKRGGVSIGGVVNFENPAAAATDGTTSKSDKHGKFRNSNANQKDSFVFEIEEPEGFRHTMSAREGSSYFKDSDMHYTANMMRNSMYNSRNSMTGRSSITGADDDRRNSLVGTRSSIIGGRGINRPPSGKKNSVTSLEMTSNKDKKKSVTAVTQGQAKSPGGSKKTLAIDAPVDIESLDDSNKASSGWKITQQPGTQIKKGFQYAYMNKLFLFYLSRFMFGSNVYPYGPSYVRKILEFIFFILCLADLALIAFILVDTYCVSGNTTSCSDHQAWVLILSVFPGAVLLAPMTGLIAMFLGPSGNLARIYALWSRLAGVNNVVILYFFLKYYRFFLASYGSIYPVLLLTSSRAFQCLFVDLYIAHVEKLRYTRGWDGLHTSLYKTKDNKKEMVL